MYRNTKKGPKRGVSLYSYSAEFGFEKTLEDCFEDVYDMGAHGIEILANIHIENYPCPTQEWADKWFALLDKYQLEPVEYGHWVDSHVLQDRDLTTEESIGFLCRDLRLAHRWGSRSCGPRCLSSTSCWSRWRTGGRSSKGPCPWRSGWGLPCARRSTSPPT